MASIFGTDGIRGHANQYPITAEVVYRAARAFASRRDGCDILIAMDTRESSPRIASWLSAGIADGGAKPRFAGHMPTPVLAHATRHDTFLGGVMVTASHNPFMDNGIKFFDQNGNKIDRDEEQLLSEAAATPTPVPGSFHELPSTPDIANGVFSRYVQHLFTVVPPQGIPSSLITLDCANGAGVALLAFLDTTNHLSVPVVHAEPDGRNINRNCGAAQPEYLPTGVAALDGDGDRLLIRDHQGRLLTGDHILLYVCETLGLTGIVGTVMTNQSVASFCQAHDLYFRRTDVGDRNVRQAMNESGVSIGGETSGHIIYDPMNHTGDGFGMYLLLQQLLANAGDGLDDIFDRYPMMPQRLVNIAVTSRIPIEQIEELSPLLRSVEHELERVGGRLFPRYSGTENLLRFLIESMDGDLNRNIANQLENFFQTRRDP